MFFLFKKLKGLLMCSTLLTQDADVVQLIWESCELDFYTKHVLWPDTRVYFPSDKLEVQLVVTCKRLLSYSHDDQTQYKLTAI